jgi:prepilin-type N-terminal cleavage/methylation domain-containing protein
MKAGRHSSRGFTLLELSIVILVLSIMLGGIIAAVTQDVRRNKKAEYNMKMAAIEAALLDFRKRYNRLPCPGGLAITIDTSTFGQEGATPGTCTGGSPAANFTDAIQTVGGAVPVHALGLPDDYVADPWGGRFLYVIDKRATATNAFTTTYLISSPPTGDDSDPPSNGSITVKDAAGNTRIGSSGCSSACKAAMLVIVSHGPNGHGAYQISGVRKSMGVTNANELKNCHCTSAAVAAAFDNIFVMAPTTISSGDASVINAFDDLVRYYTRSDFLSASEALTESQNIIK